MERNKWSPVPFGDLKTLHDAIWKFLEDSNERNKGRNARLDALTARLDALDPRGAKRDIGTHISSSRKCGRRSTVYRTPLAPRTKAGRSSSRWNGAAPNSSPKVALAADRVKALELDQRCPIETFIATVGRTSVGSLITRSGALWLATRETAATPGRDDSWRLVVKSGRAQ